MEIEDIQAFVAVADAGGLTPAASRLGVSKSIVSRRIARLEKTLRARLLTRTTRGTSLTEAGATFGGSLVASPAYLARRPAPRTPDDLHSHDLVARVNEVWPLLHDGQTISIHPRARFTADNGAALVPAVLAGLGIALLPTFLVSEHIARKEIVALMRDYPMPEAGVYVVRPPGGSAPCKVRVLIDILVEKFGDVKCTEA